MSNIKSFYCNVCHSSFNRKFNYEHHLKSKKHQSRILTNNAHICSNCKRIFKFHSGLCKHNKNCKDNIIVDTNILEKEIIELHKKNLELSKKIEDIENSKNNTNIEKQIVQNQNQNIENQNNQTNNNIIINCFGNENLDYITDKVILHCMNKIYGSIPLLIEKIHFDPDHPENHNIQIPNKKLSHAKIMNHKREWQIVKKKDAIDAMIDNGYNLLDDKLQYKLADNKQKHFRDFQAKYEDGDKDTIKNIKDTVEMLVINNSRK
jgi:hypothetical protein